ncbi:MAG: hypothetical protein PHR35_23120, partial [Kiritimatiellae bacterium]|nr:hypothetical protein [Kiritimatiellia bacterium]
MNAKINMFSADELARMLDIRKQMDELQAKYDAIVKGAEARLTAAAAAAKDAVAPTPAQGASVPAAAVPATATPAVA